MADRHVPDGDSSPPDAQRLEALKEAFRTHRGYYDEMWDDVVTFDIEFFERYERLSSLPWERGALDAKVKALIAIALNLSVTHMYMPGVRAHVRQAIRCGATREELLEVFQLVSVLGVHSLTLGIPILREELEAAEGEGAT